MSKLVTTTIISLRRILNFVQYQDGNNAQSNWPTSTIPDLTTITNRALEMEYEMPANNKEQLLISTLIA
ncbi:hypothetical protein, partial [Vibrio sp.]|uniref:hypothetical protein n=1 Tax=Vibrio sp. TaxID=678 RepID=UPI003D140676